MALRPAEVAARVLRQRAPTLSHNERRACITVADHLDAEVELGGPEPTIFHDMVRMDYDERTERVQA